MIIGAECKAYHNTGSYATPTWDEITAIVNVRLNISVGEADGSNRSSLWKITKPTLIDASVEFDIIWDNADADVTAIRGAVIGRSLLDLAIMDGAIATTGNQGLRAEMHLYGMNRDEQLENVVQTSHTAKPGSMANAPTWMTVA